MSNFILDHAGEASESNDMLVFYTSFLPYVGYLTIALVNRVL